MEKATSRFWLQLGSDNHFLYRQLNKKTTWVSCLAEFQRRCVFLLKTSYAILPNDIRAASMFSADRSIPRPPDGFIFRAETVFSIHPISTNILFPWRDEIRHRKYCSYVEILSSFHIIAAFAKWRSRRTRISTRSTGPWLKNSRESCTKK